MKSKTQKRSILKTSAALVSLFAMLASVGCQSAPAPASANPTSAATQAPAESQAPAPSQAAATDSVPFSDTLSFTFMGPMWSPYSADQKTITDEIQKRTNTNITFEWSPEDTFQEKVSTTLASGKIPEFIYGSSSRGKEVLTTLLDQGAVLPLDDLLAQYAPDYMALINPEDRVFLANASDGKMYKIMSICNYKPQFTFMVRQDWLKNVGKETPVTWDEWVDVWKAFRDQDANGDGDPNNEIPLSYEAIGGLMPVFGIASTREFAIDDNGNYILASDHPNYEKFLDAARMLYEEKLLDTEFQTKNMKELFKIMDNGTLGSTYTYAERAMISTQVNAEVNPDALWSSVVPIKGPDGHQLVPARAKFDRQGALTISAEQNGNVEKILQFMNWFYTEEGIKLSNFGIEGQHHELVNNMPLLKDPYINSFATAREAGLISQPMPLYWTDENYEQILLQGKSFDDLDAAGKSFVTGLTINDPYYFYNVPALMTEAWISLSVDVYPKFETLRDSYITGKISKDEYNQGYADLKAAGLEEIAQQGADAYKMMMGN